MTPAPFPRIPYDTAMLEYGSDKPDLRNPLRIADVTRAIRRLRLRLVRQHRSRRAASCAPSRRPGAGSPTAQLLRQAERVGARARAPAGWATSSTRRRAPKGPIAKQPGAERAEAIRTACGLQPGDAVFFVAGKPDEAAKFAGAVRNRIGEELDLYREGRVPVLLDHRLPDVRDRTRKPGRSTSATTRSPCRRAGWRR